MTAYNVTYFTAYEMIVVLCRRNVVTDITAAIAAVFTSQIPD